MHLPTTIVVHGQCRSHGVIIASYGVMSRHHENSLDVKKDLSCTRDPCEGGGQPMKKEAPVHLSKENMQRNHDRPRAERISVVGIGPGGQLGNGWHV